MPRLSHNLPFQGEEPLRFEWREADHPRGTPANAGQFVKKGEEKPPSGEAPKKTKRDKLADAGKAAAGAVAHPVETSKKAWRGIKKMQAKLEKPLLDAGYGPVAARAISLASAVWSGNPIVSGTRVLLIATGAIATPIGGVVAMLPAGQIEAGAIYLGAMALKKEGRPVANALLKDISAAIKAKVAKVIRRKKKTEAVTMQSEGKRRTPEEMQAEILKHCGHMDDDDIVKFTLALAYAMDEGEDFDDALDTALKSMAYQGEEPEDESISES